MSTSKKGAGRTWVRTSTTWYLDPKYLACGSDKLAVFGIVTGFVAYSRDQLLDGFVPSAAAFIVGAGLDPAEITRLIDLAVLHGLLEAADGGWIVPGYDKWQETAEQVEHNRNKGAERQRRWKENQRQVAGNGVTNASGNGVTDGVTNGFVSSTEEETEVEEEKNNVSAADATDAREDIDLVVAHLSSRLKSNGVKRHTPTKAWRTDARLLIDVDGYTPEQICKAIDFAANDDFWRANILSVGSLRKQYDRLRMSAMRGQGPSRVPAGQSTIAAYDGDDLGDLGGAA